MRHVRVRRSSCIHAMDASDTPRIFNPTPDVACISKQSGTLRALSRFLSRSPVPLFFFLFIFANSFFSRLLKRRATGLGLATSSPALSTGSFLSLSSLPKASELNGTRGYVIRRFWLRL